MRASARTEAIAELGERRIDQRLQDLQQGLLNEPVSDGGDTQFPHAARRLRDFHAAHGLGPVDAFADFLPNARPLGLEMLNRLLDGQPIDTCTALVGLDAFARLAHVLAPEDLRQQITSPQAFASASRQTSFITPRYASGFTRTVGDAPGLPRLLMRCPSKSHGLQPSFSFGPSPGCPGYYGLC